MIPNVLACYAGFFGAAGIEFINVKRVRRLERKLYDARPENPTEEDFYEALDKFKGIRLLTPVAKLCRDLSIADLGLHYLGHYPDKSVYEGTTLQPRNSIEDNLTE